MRLVIDIEDKVEALKRGEVIESYEYGDSMFPIFVSGEHHILTPVNDKTDIKIGDAVFCKIGNAYLTHLVWMISNGYYLIGSSAGILNGWTKDIYAIATKNGIIET